MCQQDGWYGASLELDRIMADDAEIILALEVPCFAPFPLLLSPCSSFLPILLLRWKTFCEIYTDYARGGNQMNGQPLPPPKGHPIRLIAPGIYGCRSVKWLDRITIQPTESCNFYQQRDYKILPPEAVDSASAASYWNTTPAMTETAINSIIATPQSGDTVSLSPSSSSSAAGTIEARGYAIPQGDQGPVIRVEVSIDEGQTWTDAELLNPPLDGPSAGKWSWTLWTASIPVQRGTTLVSIFSRATDSGGNTQPAVSPWNLRGVGYNGYGRAVGVNVRQDTKKSRNLENFEI